MGWDEDGEDGDRFAEAARIFRQRLAEAAAEALAKFGREHSGYVLMRLQEQTSLYQPGTHDMAIRLLKIKQRRR